MASAEDKPTSASFAALEIRVSRAVPFVYCEGKLIGALVACDPGGLAPARWTIEVHRKCFNQPPPPPKTDLERLVEQMKATTKAFSDALAKATSEAWKEVERRAESSGR